MTSSREGCGRNAMNVSVGFSVCPLAYLENHTAELSVYVDCNRDRAVLLQRRCGALCISGFVDDVVFSPNELYSTSCVFLISERTA